MVNVPLWVGKTQEVRKTESAISYQNRYNADCINSCMKKIVFLLILLLFAFYGCNLNLYGSYYHYRNGALYYYNFDSEDERIPVEGADRETFKPLGKHYAKDKDSVFIGSVKIAGADISSFEVIDDDFYYSKDARSIYCHAQKLEGADVLSWVRINQDYSRDGQSLYYCGKKLVGGDPNSFVILNRTYAKDANNVYNFRGEKLEGADVKTFQILNEFYAKDKINAYNRGAVMTADAQSFEALGIYYAKDKDSVYSNDQKIIGADPDTFVVFNDKSYLVGKDKNGVYLNGQKVPGDDPREYFH